jgi:hypothetical protein
MIDTVTVMSQISPTTEQLKEWVRNPLITPDGTVFDKYFQKALIDDVTTIGFVYYPPNPKYPNPALHIQVSLAKVLFGNNVEIIIDEGEIEEATKIINKRIAKLRWIPDVDLGEWNLWRIDAAYNYLVGDRVQDYITALSKLTYPHRKTAPYLYEGVQFRSGKHGVVNTLFYDKQKESRNPAAYGILRHESTVRRFHYIERLMGTQNPTLRDMKIDWLRGILLNDLQRLRLMDTSIYDRDQALEILLELYGWNKGTMLYGHLLAKQNMTGEQMNIYGAKGRTVQQRDKMIADAGISLTTGTRVSLPPLGIDLERKILRGVVSDTKDHWPDRMINTGDFR